MSEIADELARIADTLEWENERVKLQHAADRAEAYAKSAASTGLLLGAAKPSDKVREQYADEVAASIRDSDRARKALADHLGVSSETEDDK